MKQNKNIVSLGVMSEEEFQKLAKKNKKVVSLGKMTDEELGKFRDRILSVQGC